MWDYIEDHWDLAIYIISIAVTAIVLVRIMRLVISRFIKRRQESSGIDPTKFKFLKNSISAIIFILALVLILFKLPGGETIAVSIFASAGIIAAIVGFASQAAFSNIISGIFIVIFKPFRYGDMIQVGTGTDQRGVVEDITLRHTVIRNVLNQRIIVPNAVISDATVTNFTIVDPKGLRQVDYRVSYQTDIAKAKAIIQAEIEAHPLCIDNRDEEQIAAGTPIANVFVVELAEYAVLIRANIWSETHGDTWEVFIQTNETILERFKNEGIDIPYPHRTIVSRNDA